MVVSASQQAQRAADYVRNETPWDPEPINGESAREASGDTPSGLPGTAR